MPRTKVADPDARSKPDARISQLLRCTRKVRACLGTCILCPTVIHAHNKMHVPMGVAHTCCYQDHLQLRVLFSQRSMLGVLLPQEPMNIFGLHVKDLLLDEE